MHAEVGIFPNDAVEILTVARRRLGLDEVDDRVGIASGCSGNIACPMFGNVTSRASGRRVTKFQAF
jgi:hypothetical protein